LLELQRGIGTALEAVAILKEAKFPVRLTVLGGGFDEALLRGRAAALGLGQEHVDFRGQVPNDVALGELPLAHVGIVPHWKDESWDTTIPNKIFDYMAAGLAVVTSDAAPVARIVRTSGCGAVFPDRDPAALAAALRRFADPAVRRVAGECGRAAIRATYHWEQDVSRMLDLVTAVMQRPSTGGVA